MIDFYKPNSYVKGSACRFYLNEQENSFFASIIRQKSWDAKARKASFHANDPQNKVIIKFSRVEICSIIDAIKRNVEFHGYHGSNQVVRFRFEPYYDKVEEKEVHLGDVVVCNEKATLAGQLTKTEKFQKGFSFSVNKEMPDDSTSKEFFVIGFTFPECVELVIFLESIVLRSFEIKRRERIKIAKEKAKEEKEAEKKAPEPESKPKDDDSEIW